jgi:hypothetical protein
MESRFEMLKQLGTRRVFALACTSVVMYASTMLALALFTEPVATGSAIMALVTPAAEASQSAPQAPRMAESGTPAWNELTVYFPETFPPVGGDVAEPIAQF